MTPATLKRIEVKLGIKLPHGARATLGERGADLKSTYRIRDTTYPAFMSPKELISTNLTERLPDSGTGYAFPGWWKSYVIIGSDGGGGYHCLRLDGKPGIWMLGSDDNDKAEPIYSTLTDYIDATLRRTRVHTRRYPLPGRSSFDDSCSPLERIGVFFDLARYSGKNCEVVFQDQDRFLNRTKLEKRDFHWAIVGLQLRDIAAIVMKCDRAAVTIEYDKKNADGWVSYTFGRFPRPKQGYEYVMVNMFDGNIDICFAGFTGYKQLPDRVVISWSKFRAAMAELLAILHPGLTAGVGAPVPTADHKHMRSYRLVYELSEQ